MLDPKGRAVALIFEVTNHQPQPLCVALAVAHRGMVPMRPLPAVDRVLPLASAVILVGGSGSGSGWVAVTAGCEKKKKLKDVRDEKWSRVNELDFWKFVDFFKKKIGSGSGRFFLKKISKFSFEKAVWDEKCNCTNKSEFCRFVYKNQIISSTHKNWTMSTIFFMISHRFHIKKNLYEKNPISYVKKTHFT
jgi:hypothetical protein